MRHIIYGLLILVSLISAPQDLLAFWDFEYQELYYKITDSNSVEVISSRYRDGVVSVPASATYNGKEYRVRKIAYRAFADCENLLDITIDEGVEIIDHSAFRNCKNLRSCSLPKSLRELGHDAFQNCENLRNITIGPNVGKIGIQAFHNCANLEKLTIESESCVIEIHAFEGCKRLDTIILKGQQPIRINSSSFNGVPDSAEVLAGKKCATKLRKDQYWQRFKNIRTIKY